MLNTKTTDKQFYRQDHSTYRRSKIKFKEGSILKKKLENSIR